MDIPDITVAPITVAAITTAAVTTIITGMTPITAAGVAGMRATLAGVAAVDIVPQRWAETAPEQPRVRRMRAVPLLAASRAPAQAERQLVVERLAVAAAVTVVADTTKAISRLRRATIHHAKAS